MFRYVNNFYICKYRNDIKYKMSILYLNLLSNIMIYIQENDPTKNPEWDGRAWNIINTWKELQESCKLILFLSLHQSFCLLFYLSTRISNSNVRGKLAFYLLNVHTGFNSWLILEQINEAIRNYCVIYKWIQSREVLSVLSGGSQNTDLFMKTLTD